MVMKIKILTVFAIKKCIYVSGLQGKISKMIENILYAPFKRLSIVRIQVLLFTFISFCIKY